MGIFDELNEEQQKPVLDTEGAVLVLAGAGSGKTRVLTARIAYLLEKGVPPESILAITFTNKAAREMRGRLENEVGVGRMWVCTIHSMCVKILRMFAEKRGIRDNFSIYSEQERNAIVKQAFKELGFEEESLLKSARFHISNAKMLGLPPAAYAVQYRHERNIDEIVTVYERYQKHLKAYNALDFDDLLTETRSLLSEDAEAREYLAGKFRYIHVDEFQDTNAVQFDIIKLLASVHGNLFVVGDDDQSIYGWRGAKIENILHFERSFPAMKMYKLQRNYRSTGAILALANASIAHNAFRRGKELWTDAPAGDKPVYYEADEEAGEALYCARLIAEARRGGAKYSDFAVLMRINALTRSFEQEFTGYGIPYKVFGGFKFFERKEIKDILAYLRVIANPFDSEAVMRVINVPRRGIGDKTVQTLSDFAQNEDLSLYDAVLAADELPLAASAREKVRSFGAYIKDLVYRSQELPVDKLTAYLINSSGMLTQYADNSDESVTKRANIDEFQNSVDEFVRMNEGASLADYLQEITLYSDTDEMDDGDYVTLATIHAVKGLEFSTVFLIGLEENVMPTSRASDSTHDLEEERRLMYVAITRAKRRLYLTRSRSRYLYGKREPTARSRFVEELKEELALPEDRSRSRLGYGGYAGGGYGGGYGGGDGYGGTRGDGAARRVGSYSEQRESASYPTFGTGKPPVRSAPATAGQPSAPKRDTSRFRVGVKVRHTRFGEGEIVAMRGVSDNLILTVRFEAAGNKDLAAALAPLEILE